MSHSRNLEEKTIESQPIFHGKVISLQVDKVLLPDGNTSTREIVKHPGAVGILAFVDQEHILIVRQYRKALGKEIFEIPAGKLDPGERPEDTAKRELEEETGYQAKSVRFINSFYTSPGFANELLYLYEADQLVKGTLNLDQDEFLEVHTITLREALQLMQTEKIHDAKTAFAIMYWQLKQLQGGTS
jgi:ADP-ribose pyrophosphatase